MPVKRPPSHPAIVHDNSIETYHAKRDFTRTPEPKPRSRKPGKTAIFVVQRHDASRLHYDFRLEHAGVLWSWAVPKGPSLDPHDKRLAVRVEDHPVTYANFSGTIPAGNYGAGTVAIWDHGTWEPSGDPAADLQAGEMKFRLHGGLLRGGFVLVRLPPRPGDRAENWLLIKEHDADEQAGATAAVLAGPPAPNPTPTRLVAAAPARGKPRVAPLPGAMRAEMPRGLAPQLATPAEAPSDGAGWISEIKFDGYRMLIFKDGKTVRVITRNGLDWTARLPELAKAVAKLKPATLVLDGELVVLRTDGVSSFAALQAALAGETDRAAMHFFAFDLPYLDGWDLRDGALSDRKAALRGVSAWDGMLRFSDHLHGQAVRVRLEACRMGLEGIICKRADAPYRGGRGRDWLKAKCQGREEFVVLGWTPPEGSRHGFGALHLGFHDTKGGLQYVGGVGSGFDAAALARIGRRLTGLAATPPPALILSGDAPPAALRWVRPALVIEVQYTGWTGAGRLRHAVFLGEREDKPAEEVVRTILPDPAAERHIWTPKAPTGTRIVRATAPGKAARAIGAVSLTHADKALWPGISKADLAAYWQAVAAHALPGLARRPLSLVRCPDGIDGQHFFQKHGNRGMPAGLREGESDEGPYLALDDETGLVACAQIAAIELHSWGAAERDPAHPDRIVFDLDPGDGVAFPELVRAALLVRARLKTLGLISFCRTTGGKGLHVVAPLRPKAGWDAVKPWCQGFARAMEADQPDNFVAVVAKAKRRGRILVDWLRNGPGATAVASYSPRARPGAGVATPLAWREVTAKLDPTAFTIATVPARLARQKSDPWSGFDASTQILPKDFR